MTTETGRTRTTNLAARREKARLPKVVWLADDLDLAGQIEELEEELKSARLRAEAFKDDERAQALYAAAQEALDVCLKANEGNYTEFKFWKLGYKAYDELISEHPPTEQQVAKAKEMGMDNAMPWNPETFMSALILRSMRQPDLRLTYSEEEYEEDLVDLQEATSMGELQILFHAALEVNTVGININRITMGKGSSLTNGSKKSRPTSSRKVSH